MLTFLSKPLVNSLSTFGVSHVIEGKKDSKTESLLTRRVN